MTEPVSGAKAPSPSILMAIPFIAAVAVPVAILMILVPGLWPGIIRGFGSVLHIMRESPFPVTGFTVHYFSRDSRGHALTPWRVKAWKQEDV
jgi:hypothetical protein